MQFYFYIPAFVEYDKTCSPATIPNNLDACWVDGMADKLLVTATAMPFYDHFIAVECKEQLAKNEPDRVFSSYLLNLSSNLLSILSFIKQCMFEPFLLCYELIFGTIKMYTHYQCLLFCFVLNVFRIFGRGLVFLYNSPIVRVWFTINLIFMFILDQNCAIALAILIYYLVNPIFNYSIQSFWLFNHSPKMIVDAIGSLLTMSVRMVGWVMIEIAYEIKHVCHHLLADEINILYLEWYDSALVTIANCFYISSLFPGARTVLNNSLVFGWETVLKYTSILKIKVQQLFVRFTTKSADRIRRVWCHIMVVKH